MAVWLQRFRFRAHTLRRRDAMERELDAELQFHLDMQTAENVRRGMLPEAARRDALRAFGALEAHREECRERWGSRIWETLRQDIANGLRSTREAPAAALLIVIALGLGLGSSAAVLSVFRGVMFDPLPYRDADRLVLLEASMPKGGVDDALLSVSELRDLRGAVRSLGAVAELHRMYFLLNDSRGSDEASGEATAERLHAAVVSANYFDVLGVEPVFGRSFLPEEGSTTPARAVVLGHDFWQRRFGGDPSVVGRTLLLNQMERHVVGVLPPLPDLPAGVEVYLPTPACPLRISTLADQGRGTRILSAIARIQGGATLRDVGTELDALASRLRREHPLDYPARFGFAITAQPIRQVLTRDFRPTWTVIAGAAAFLLLTLCSSVAAMLLARCIRRRREMVLRSALGAWQGRLFRQFATENCLLALGGAALGLLVARLCLGPLVELAERYTPGPLRIGVDGVAVLLSLLITLLTGPLFGAITLLAGRTRPAEVRHAGSVRFIGHRRSFGALIVAQIAVSSTLLIGAGLMLRSLLNLQRSEPGMDTEGVWTGRLSLDFLEYPFVIGRSAMFQQLVDGMARRPGVEALAAVGSEAVSHSGMAGDEPLMIAAAGSSEETPPRVSVFSVTPRYFETLGMTLLEGRPFTERDDLFAPDVAVISRSLARRHWGFESDALGERIRFAPDGAWVTVVGVASDVRRQPGGVERGEVYRPMYQQPTVEARVVVRGIGGAALEQELRRTVAMIDPRQSLEALEPLDGAWSESLASPRRTTVVLMLFALVSLVTAAIGTGVVVAMSVDQRIREYGLLMALGATRGRVLLMVLRQGVLLAAAGLLLGVAGAVVLLPLMRSLLFGVNRYDPLTFAVVGCVLLAVAMGVSFAPALRASRVDPLETLRHA